MLTKQRHEIILHLLEEKGSITASEVKALLDTSESTVRRDIAALDAQGKLIKVFGGAVAAEREVTAHEYTVAQKNDLNNEEKRRIGQYAATLIEPNDFVFLDAGTTTAHMIEFITARSATFVPNAVAHAQRLVKRGMKVLLVGGELKASTEAVVGAQAMNTLLEYHFTKGFFGSNGVTKNSGCTTPDAKEALVKRIAIRQCKTYYVLCDHTKFGNVSSVSFAPFERTTFLTDSKISGYGECDNIIVAAQL